MSTEQNNPQEISLGIHLENNTVCIYQTSYLEIPVFGTIRGELCNFKDKYFLIIITEMCFTSMF